MAGPLRIMVFDRDRVAGELEHLGIGEAETFALGIGDRHVPSAVAVLGIDHAQMLASQRTAEDSAVAGAKSRLVDVELVGIDRPLHDVLTQPIAARPNSIWRAICTAKDANSKSETRRALSSFHCCRPWLVRGSSRMRKFAPC